MALEKEIQQWEQMFAGFPYSVYIGDMDTRRIIVFPQQASTDNAVLGDKSDVTRLSFEQWYLAFSEEELGQLRKDIVCVVRREQHSALERVYRMSNDQGDWGYYHHCIKPYTGKTFGDIETDNCFIGVVREVSDAFKQGCQLRDSEERYRLLATNSKDLIWTTDIHFNLTYISPSVTEVTGLSFEDMLFTQKPAFFSSQTNQDIHEIFDIHFHLNHPLDSPVCPVKQFHVLERELLCADGQKIAVEMQLSVLYDDMGDIQGTLGVARNITERKVIEREQRLLSTAFESSGESIFITDDSGILIRANQEFYATTGYLPEEVMGRYCGFIWPQPQDKLLFLGVKNSISETNRWRGECEYANVKGELRPSLLSFSAARDENSDVTHYVGIFLDIADKKSDEEKIRRLAYFDALTGIPNRSLFNERLEKTIAQASRNNTSAAVLFLDLDRFKPINDSFGHAAGDQLLTSVASRLQGCIREEDTVARMGGDEFAIVLSSLPSVEEAEEIVIATANRIISSFVQPFLIEGREAFTSASLGVAVYPCDGASSDELLRNADMAMYSAKKLGKNNYQFYDQVLNAQAVERLFIENAMRKALVNDEFCMYFQPQYWLSNGVMSGVEALLRWHHPKFGTLSPAQFIELAEESDLIIPIGEWVFENVCSKIQEWRNDGVHLPRVAINVSAAQFKRRRFAEWAMAMIDKYQVPAGMLELEITETVLMEDIEHTIAVLNEFKTAGLRIAVDDFGTGYSSLSYLKKFPIDTLKIDRDFVKDIDNDEGGVELTHAVIAIAKSLGLGVIAEGVETREQLSYLGKHNCDEAQGHYLSPALSELDLLELVACEVAG
ncbi:hypothetical protein A9Q99_02005 [Gammaproteobacteria bacterium 45_16_T64]|nr:hypothetical protein A9Q99_02005 [Gammaproteobacteria bacterium 45_16_T64]